MKAYVYTHTRLDTNEIFYVGIGTQDNYKRASHSHNRTNYWNNIVKKCGWKVDIVFDKLTWEEACKKEVELIKKYGRIDLGTGTLVNLTEGGEGAIGRVVKEETRYKMSIAKKGKKGLRQSKEQRQKTSELMRGVNSKKIINTKSGIIYNSIQEAAEQNNIKRATLSNYLTGRTKNNTNLKYY